MKDYLKLIIALILGTIGLAIQCVSGAYTVLVLLLVSLCFILIMSCEAEE